MAHIVCETYKLREHSRQYVRLNNINKVRIRINQTHIDKKTTRWHGHDKLDVKSQIICEMVLSYGR